ncbi:MAG: Crp/Fnr family transcriptional regulator [Saprospiraceae bacterium]
MHVIHEFMLRYTVVSNADWERIKPFWELQSFKAGEYVLQANKICRHVWFLESGLLHYFIEKDGLPATKFFTIAPYCFTSQRSFNQQIPAKESIAAIEDSRVWAIKRDDVNALFALPCWASFVRGLTQEVQFFTEQILEELQNKTAEERYCKMLAAGDPLLQRIPLKILASYLGIAPQSLSRIRKKLILKRGETEAQR